jgi:GTP-binding protein EngB required for normal cell division
MRSDNVALVVFGPSQVGKSSFVKSLREHYGVVNGKNPQVSTGNGCSVTSSAEIFNAGDLGIVADMGGWNNSDLRFTSQDMADQTSTGLTVRSIEKVRFLVFDSLSGDTMQIRHSITELVKGFGESSKSGIIVVASKLDKVDSDELGERLNYMREAMQDLCIEDRLVTWQSKSFNAVCAFKDQLESTPPVATNALQVINSLIVTRAQELCDQQDFKKSNVVFRTQENFVVERRDYESYEEPYWEKE